MSAIRNYTSELPINRIFAQLQRTLAEHGAKQITLDYGEGGQVDGVTFVVIVKERPFHVRLPARVDKAQAVLKQQYEAGVIPRKEGKKVYSREHAYRVAWRNILDWVNAQMALLDIEMAQLEEVFLPYMVTRTGKTLFEAMERSEFRLESGEEKVAA